MLPRTVSKMSLVLGIVVSLLGLPCVAAAQPDPAMSTCNVVIIQGPCPSAACLAAGGPVARLCPLGDWDKIEFRGVVRDAAAVPLAGILVKPVEVGASTLNLATGGFTTVLTNALGEFLITVGAGSGCGRVGVCVGGPLAPIFLNCSAIVRSPDVAGGPIPATCPLPTGVNSFVNASDITNGACGYIVKFGLVVPGFNDCYDLNCNGVVNASDINGTLCPPFGLNGGVLQHFGHGGLLGMRNTCP